MNLPDNPNPPPALSYASPDTGKRIVIARFSTAYEARLAASKLDAESIPCGVSESRSAYVGSSGSALLVSADDLARAVSILSASPARSALTVTAAPLPPAPPRVLPVCPHCGSSHLGPAPRRWHIAAGLLALCWIPFVVWESLIYVIGVAIFWTSACLIFRPTRCLDCGQKLPDDDRED